MTDIRLREALSDLADTVPATDLVTGRWQEGVRRRRRRAVGSAVLAVAVAAGAVAVATVPGGSSAPLPPTSPTTIDVTPDPPDAYLGDVPVYLSPDVADERILPQYDGPLPSRVTVEGRVERAVYAEPVPLSGLPMGIRVVGWDGTGEAVPVPLGRFDLAFEGGRLPFTPYSLSPDGTRLRLVTLTGFATYDLRNGRWTEQEGSGDIEERMHEGWGRTRMPTGLPDDVSGVLGESVGPRVGGLGRYAGGYTARDLEVLGHQAPSAIFADGALLAINGEGRADCCSVAGWLEDDWVVYESRVQREVRLIAWNTRDGQFMKVASLPRSTFAGTGVGSYANFSVAE